VSASTRIEPSFALDGAHRPDSVRFCSRCGHTTDERVRVCDQCGMGVVLTGMRTETALDGAAFLICTHDLTVTAVSQAGEKIFGKQDRLVGLPLLDLVTCPVGEDQLGRYAALAALRPCDPVVLPLRLVAPKRSIGTLAARISTCGPPRAALVTVEPSAFGRR
jgi:hypothetical protein